MSDFIVTIDGPCGAGKTTIAKALAEKLGLMYLDTGGLYRAVAYEAIQENFDLETSTERERHALAQNVFDHLLEIAHGDNGEMAFYIDGENISSKIRTQKISDLASKISVYPEVREFVNIFCRRLGEHHGLIAEGRDTGTVLFPNATVRFYLTANLNKRAERRQNQTPGEFEDLNAAINKTEERDDRDMGRDTAPLPTEMQAHENGMVVIDSTDTSLQDTIDTMYDIVITRMPLN